MLKKLFINWIRKMNNILYITISHNKTITVTLMCQLSLNDVWQIRNSEGWE